jgi:hypothetical protein
VSLTSTTKHESHRRFLAQVAATMVNQSLAINDNHLPSLIAYSYFARSYCKLEDALRGLLKAIVLDQGNKRTRRLLAKVLRMDNGLEMLWAQLSPHPASAAAYAFLATICKEHSALSASVGLLRRYVLIPLRCKMLAVFLKIPSTGTNFCIVCSQLGT